jgi:two-component system response regulator PilR (NtrC family)
MSEHRILVVDDDERVLFVLRRVLLAFQNGYEIVTAPDGREALNKAKEVPFDLLITDLKMPGVDGITLTQAIRDLDSDTVVVWITAYGCAQVSDEATRLSVHECLEKPLRIDEIRRVVREALKNSKG